MVADEIRRILNEKTTADEETMQLFLHRLSEGKITRDENVKTHFCVYFLPYNPATKEVFIVHHKKSGLWISPGGHIDRDDPSLLAALNREISEELGMKDFFKIPQRPFLLTTVIITDPNHPCDMHYDLWYLVATDGSQFNVDPTEFHETQWMTLDAADQATADPSNKKAFQVLRQLPEGTIA